MSALQDNSRPNSRSSSSKNNSDIRRAFTESNYQQDIISQANSVLLSQIFKHYGISFNNTNKIICPFPTHNDNTASFIFYKQTNSFYCFGCHTGSRCADFVAKMDSTTKEIASKKILSLFEGQSVDIADSYPNAKEKLEILNKFSNEVLNFKRRYFDKESRKFIEDLCRVYDDIHYKKSLSNEALLKMTELFNLKIQNYKL